MTRHSPLLRLAAVGGMILLAPAVSLVLTSANITHASLTTQAELSPATPVSFDLCGVTGKVRLNGRFCPEAGHALHARGVLHMVLVSTDGIDSTVISLDREIRGSVAFPRREHPRRVSLAYIPAPGSELGAALIVTNLMVTWNERQSLPMRTLDALGAWLYPSAIQNPVGLFYVLSLGIGILALTATLLPRAWRKVLVLGGGWSWFFLSALLLNSFPSAFSPLTRIPLLGETALSTVVLAAAGLMLVKTAVRSPLANRYAYVVVLLGCGLVRVFLAREVMDRQPKDIDEIVYAGVAQNLVLGHGFMVPDSAYKTRELEHIDPVRKLWWKNNLYLGISRKGEQTAAIPPLYPLVLSLFVSPDGMVHGSAYLMQAMLGFGTCILLYFVGVRTVGSSASLAGLLFASMHAPMAAVCRYLFTETLFFFTLMLAIFFLLRGRSVMLSGVCLALAVLTRSVALVLLPVWIVLAFVLPKKPARSWKTPAFVLAGFFLVCAPWAVRNLYAVGEPVIGSTFAGKDLFVGNNDTYRRLVDPSPPQWEDLTALQRTVLALSGIKRHQTHHMFSFPIYIQEESARSNELRCRATAFMITYPRAFLKLVSNRILSLFERLGPPPQWSRSGHLPLLLWPILLLSPVGFIWAKGRFLLRFSLVVAAILLVMPPLISIGFPRYRLPFDLLLSPMAGAGLCVVMACFGIRRVDDSTPTGMRNREPEEALTGGSDDGAT